MAKRKKEKCIAIKNEIKSHFLGYLNNLAFSAQPENKINKKKKMANESSRCYRKTVPGHREIG